MPAQKCCHRRQMRPDSLDKFKLLLVVIGCLSRSWPLHTIADLVALTSLHKDFGATHPVDCTACNDTSTPKLALASFVHAMLLILHCTKLKQHPIFSTHRSRRHVHSRACKPGYVQLVGLCTTTRCARLLFKHTVFSERLLHLIILQCTALVIQVCPSTMHSTNHLAMIPAPLTCIVQSSGYTLPLGPIVPPLYATQSP